MDVVFPEEGIDTLQSCHICHSNLSGVNSISQADQHRVRRAMGPLMTRPDKEERGVEAMS